MTEAWLINLNNKIIDQIKVEAKIINKKNQ